ncbi:MAG: hypothetical protein ABR581_02575 [Thermoleophilaceae bacterium]
MKRFLLLLPLVVGALALPGVADARIVQLGTTADPVRSKCPGDPCEVLARTTGYQGRAGAVRNPFHIPRAGYIVAFSVTLAPLQDTQISFFNDTFGAPAQVRLSILRRGKRRRTRRNHRLIAQSKLFRVDQYIGLKNPITPGFVLDRPLRVRHNYILALTTPTWAPAFVGGISNGNWWRSSRRRGRCSARYVTQRSAQQHVGGVRRYGCTYRGARIMYTATYVPDPRPAKR